MEKEENSEDIFPNELFSDSDIFNIHLEEEQPNLGIEVTAKKPNFEEKKNTSFRHGVSLSISDPRNKNVWYQAHEDSEKKCTYILKLEKNVHQWEIPCFLPDFVQSMCFLKDILIVALQDNSLFFIDSDYGIPCLPSIITGGNIIFIKAIDPCYILCITSYRKVIILSISDQKIEKELEEDFFEDLHDIKNAMITFEFPDRTISPIVFYKNKAVRFSYGVNHWVAFNEEIPEFFDSYSSEYFTVADLEFSMKDALRYCESQKFMDSYTRLFPIYLEYEPEKASILFRQLLKRKSDNIQTYCELKIDDLIQVTIEMIGDNVEFMESIKQTKEWFKASQPIQNVIKKPWKIDRPASINFDEEEDTVEPEVDNDYSKYRQTTITSNMATAKFMQTLPTIENIQEVLRQLNATSFYVKNNFVKLIHEAGENTERAEILKTQLNNYLIEYNKKISMYTDLYYRVLTNRMTLNQIITYYENADIRVKGYILKNSPLLQQHFMSLQALRQNSQNMQPASTSQEQEGDQISSFHVSEDQQETDSEQQNAENQQVQEKGQQQVQVQQQMPMQPSQQQQMPMQPSQQQQIPMQPSQQQIPMQPSQQQQMPMQPSQQQMPMQPSGIRNAIHANNYVEAIQSDLIKKIEIQKKVIEEQAEILVKKGYDTEKISSIINFITTEIQSMNQKEFNSSQEILNSTQTMLNTTCEREINNFQNQLKNSITTFIEQQSKHLNKQQKEILIANYNQYYIQQITLFKQAKYNEAQKKLDNVFLKVRRDKDRDLLNSNEQNSVQKRQLMSFQMAQCQQNIIALDNTIQTELAKINRLRSLYAVEIALKPNKKDGYVKELAKLQENFNLIVMQRQKYMEMIENIKKSSSCMELENKPLTVDITDEQRNQLVYENEKYNIDSLAKRFEASFTSQSQQITPEPTPKIKAKSITPQRPKSRRLKQSKLNFPVLNDSTSSEDEEVIIIDDDDDDEDKGTENKEEEENNYFDDEDDENNEEEKEESSPESEEYNAKVMPRRNKKRGKA